MSHQGGTLALCPSCRANRSSVGKGQRPVRLPPGPDIDVLGWVATAHQHTLAAERALAAAVTRARQAGASWSVIGAQLGISRRRLRKGTYEGDYSRVREQPGPGRRLDWSRITHLLRPTPRPPGVPVATPVADGVERLAAHVARQHEGNRDNALFWAACRTAEGGRVDAEPLVAAAISAGLPEVQARRTVRSAYDIITRGPGPSAGAPPPSKVPTR